MGWAGFRGALALVGAIFLCAAARPAIAADFTPGETCHIAVGANQSYESLAKSPELWTCQDRSWSITQDRAILRFDLRGAENPQPTRLVTRLTDFGSLRITALATDGTRAVRLLSPADMTPATSDWLMQTALPKLDRPLSAIIVEIEEPRHRGTLSEARLESGTDGTADSIRHELLVAFICGILLLPLVFNFAFYRILRERFLYWHALAVTFMLVQTAVTSGIISRFATLSVETLSLLSPVSWGAGIVAAALFSADLIEDGMLDARHRTIMRLIAPWVMFWSFYYPLASGPLRSTAASFYFASFIPVIALFVWIIAVAWSRGSRAVNFQIMAWLPIMVTGSIRIVSTIWTDLTPMELQFQQHVSIALEVVITSLGVADRFMLIRTQRDRARAQARRFEDMAERDPLTGLLNRRAIEDRFDTLHLMGYRCMAVIDLDHFKTVNDLYGHATGDQVLKSAAAALAPDDNTLAVRMGGEEFLLLLRGDDAALRAERRRRSIPTRVAADVPGLGCLVTASMGMVEHDSGQSLAADFTRAYAHCDRLLYEAKHNGRNRTMSAFVRHFIGGSRREEAA